jgi:hypothetical protein
MTEAELVAAQQRVERFLAAKGIADEDLCQEMLLVLLEREGAPTHLHWVYLRACDRLDPRICQHGERVRRHAVEQSLDAPLTAGAADTFLTVQAAPAAPEALPDLEALHQRGPLRALLLLRLYYGLEEKELAWLWGVSEGRISQQLGGGKSAVLCGHVPARDLVFEELTWSINWISF